MTDGTKYHPEHEIAKTNDGYTCMIVNAEKCM